MGTEEFSFPCPLCRGGASFFKSIDSRQYLRCRRCGSVFMDSESHLSLSREKERYVEHNNDPSDRGYRRFVAEIVKRIKENFSPRDKGLDFGSGPGSPITAMLKESGYRVVEYDPFFREYPELLEKRYDYIACCEVIEHFREPGKEFKLLKDLLKEKGMLLCKTELFLAETDFVKWYYKNDPSHVFFYTSRSFELIRDMFNFSRVEIEGRLIEFRGHCNQ